MFIEVCWIVWFVFNSVLGAQMMPVAKLPHLNYVGQYYQLSKGAPVDMLVVETSVYQEDADAMAQAKKSPFVLRCSINLQAGPSKTRQAELDVMMPPNMDYTSLFARFLLVLHYNQRRLTIIWNHAGQILSSQDPTPSPSQSTERYREIKLGSEMPRALPQREVMKPSKVIKSNERPTYDRNDPSIVFAKSAVLTNRKALKLNLEAAREERIKADVWEDSAYKQIDSIRRKTYRSADAHRVYKRNIAIAQNLLEETLAVEASRKRELVRRHRDLDLLKRTCFPFRPAGKLLLSSGPIPYKRLAQSKPARRAITYVYDKNGRKRSVGQDTMNGESSALHRAFEAIREMAATNDPFYLDFDKLTFNRETKITKKRFFKRILGGVGVAMNHRERALLWNHFAPQKNAFEITVEDLKQGFYNQRKLLSKSARLIQSATLRETSNIILLNIWFLTLKELKNLSYLN